jgi:hypothetical protein
MTAVKFRRTNHFSRFELVDFLKRSSARSFNLRLNREERVGQGPKSPVPLRPHESQIHPRGGGLNPNGERSAPTIARLARVRYEDPGES